MSKLKKVVEYRDYVVTGVSQRAIVNAVSAESSIKAFKRKFGHQRVVSVATVTGPKVVWWKKLIDLGAAAGARLVELWFHIKSWVKS